jgi:hypothetical protein
MAANNFPKSFGYFTAIRMKSGISPGQLANAMGIGFTFGGQNFFGHGVYLSSGSATFKVNSYTVR